MHELQVFEHNVFGKIRVRDADGEPWFVAMDVAKALGYARPADAVSLHCKKSIKTTITAKRSNGKPMPPTNIIEIPESDVYRLVMRSNRPEAEAFQDWVCDDVLPSIRKHGGYIHTAEEDTPELIMAKALKLADATIKNQEQRLKQMATKIEEDKPKVKYATDVENSTNSIDIGTFSSILHNAGLKIGRNRVFEKLRELGYVFRKGRRWNLPTQECLNRGLMEVHQTTYDSNGKKQTGYTTLITGKGKLFFHQLFMKLFYDKYSDDRRVVQQSLFPDDRHVCNVTHFSL